MECKRRRGGYSLASEVTGIQITTLYSMVSKKQIPHIRISPRLVLFDQDELENWMKARRGI